MKAMKTIGWMALCVILGTGTLQAAGTGDPQGSLPSAGPGPAIIKAFARLNLTPEQKSAIAEVIRQHRDMNRAALDEVIEARKLLFAQIHDDVVNEPAIRGASRVVSLKEENLAVCRARTVAAMKSVLTPDQLKIVKEIRATATDRLEAQRGRIPALLDAWVEAHLAAN